MATKGEYLVNQTVNDATGLVAGLQGNGANISRIYQRWVALGAPALVGFEWPEGYTQADFESLMTVLNALPRIIVTDAARNALYKLIATFQ